MPAPMIPPPMMATSKAPLDSGTRVDICTFNYCRAGSWQNFAMTVIQISDVEVSGIYSEFLRVPALSLGVYENDAGASVPQDPRGEDEVYHVVSGSGQIAVEGTDYAEIGRAHV